MNLFDVLTLIGGLSLFLFGMNLMGQALERRAGNRLRGILEKMTTNRLAGFLTGLGITAIIQSSSATTVMVVGFVNSGFMTLRQAINVIMGANVGTTVTSWILSLSGISGDNFWIQLLKPTSFTPILALIGTIFLMFGNRSEKKDTGTILLGFAVLMFGMDTMSGAVSGLAEVPAFQKLFVMFENPLLGLLVGAVLTAIIQSSSASVGILQALSATGQVTLGAAIPIIMGQNIGTCITAVISAVGANKNGKRTALVHLAFNTIGSIVLLSLFSVWKYVFEAEILQETATVLLIAIVHTVFNIVCVILLMPNAGLLEKLALKIIRDEEIYEKKEELDSRLLATPTLALEQCRGVVLKMAGSSVRAMKGALTSVIDYTEALAEKVREEEKLCDHYEDIIGTYLVNLSAQSMGTDESEEAAVLLKMIGDLERISDHAVNILESAEEVRAKNLTLTESAVKEFDVLATAITEILDISYRSFSENNVKEAEKVEPLEEVVDLLKECMRSRHIVRMQQGKCSIEAGFVWSDLLTNLERTSDHCSNIAGCIIETAQHNLNLHESQKMTVNENDNYKKMYESFLQKYKIK